MKFSKLFIILLLINNLPYTNINAQNSNNSILKTVVIDAGHGGSDPGTVYGKNYEKNITLSIALELGKLINQRHPDVKVIYTRKTDVAVDLYKRAQIANDANADLFLSIHVNSARNTSARGVETYLIGSHKSEANMEVAMKENSVITLEDDYHQKYEGFDPKSAESYIIFSLMQSSFLEQSSIFASAIQEEYMKNTVSANRGVKQAGFLVLWRTSMPSVLTEIGFLSNVSDRSYLINQEKRNKIVLSLLNAFTRYKKEVDSGVRDISVSMNNGEEDYQGPEPQSNVIITPVEESKPQETAPTTPLPDDVTKESIYYRIQVLSSSKSVAMDYKNFGKYAMKVFCDQSSGNYKYYLKAKTYKEAVEMQKLMRNFKFKDAFVVAYSNYTKIDVKQAISLTE